MFTRSKPIRQTIHRHSRAKSRKLAITILLSACVFSAGAFSNPDSPVVIAGSANFDQLGNQLSITNSPGTIIDWKGFSIDRNEITRFLQQSDQSAVLNRVTGSGASNIFGELLSNGKVFLVNPNGIIIGNGARIDTAGFIGSSLDISNEDFQNGRYEFKGSGGSVINNGSITAGPGGEVILIAPTVENSGDITVVDGEIILAAGQEVTLTSLSDANISFRVSAPGNKALNIGSLTASNGAIGVFANQVMSSGNISANRVSTNARGQIVLQADASTEVGGTITATGNGVPGGDVTVLGDHIQLTSAQIDTTGTNGGRVLIGGDFQGTGDLQRATRTDIDVNSVIHADALEQGNGGEIIVWSEQATNSQGRLTARGGSVAGNGGLVETSSRGNLQFGQPADVSAVNGSPGTWLLDPEDIVIGSAHADSISAALNGGSNVQVKTAETGSGEGNISVNAPIRKTEGPDAALGLVAHNRIDVNAPIESTSGKLNLSLKAGRDIAVNASIDTNGGSYSANIVPSLLPQAAEDTEEDIEAETESLPVAQEEAEETDSEVDPSDDEMTTESDSITPNEEELEQETVNTVISQPTNTIGLNENGISIDATVNTSGGDIDLNAGDTGLLQINESIISSGEQAGDVQLLGDQVAIYDDVLIDASSASGGGEILIGGDQQGLNPEIPNSDAVYIAESASIHADGLETSDGGRVIVYAESVANIDGEISARGGDNGGAGGFVETSGRDKLRVRKAPDVSAANGVSGNWLIDPSTINITDDTSNTNITPSMGMAGTEFTTTGDNFTSTLSVSELAIALGSGANVQVVTSALGNGTGDINLLADLNTSQFSNGTVGGLTLSAHNDINIRNSIIGTGSTELASLTLIANSDNANGGDVNIDATGKGSRLDIETRGELSITGENLTIRGGSDTDEETVNIDTDGGFQIDIANQIEFISNDQNSDVTLRSRNGTAGANRIEAENLVLRSIGNGRSRISAFSRVFPAISVGEIQIADTLTLNGGAIGSDLDIFTNNLVWNSGTITPGGGSLNTSGTVTIDSLSAVSLSRGNWNVGAGSTVNWDSGDIGLQGTINNAGTFNANGNDSAFTGADAFSGTFNNTGTFRKTNACEPDCQETVFDSTGAPIDFNNAGEVIVEAGDLLFIQQENFTPGEGFLGGFSQTAGSTTLSGGNLVAQVLPVFTSPPPVLDPGMFEFTGGTIAGGTNDSGINSGGTISGITEVDGATIAAGFSPGTLIFNGDLSVSNSSTIAVQLDGTNSGEFDVVNVTGNATLDNPTVDVEFLGYTPPDVDGAEDSFDVFTAQSLTVNPSAEALNVNQPADLPANILPSSGQFDNNFFLAYLFDASIPVTPVNPEQPATTVDPGMPSNEPGLMPFPSEDPGSPPITILTSNFPPSTRIPRTIPGLQFSDDPDGVTIFDPTNPVISLYQQTPNLQDSEDGPEFLQCY
ncbi:MAG: filamentous hemagglutinin N-terminal domain-containing protein [Acidiferrobacterales bacterium]|nr:filamentous hemagglutinin N-terminal domain-containing protein [Acidiferrobacterales bacterium]